MINVRIWTMTALLLTVVLSGCISENDKANRKERTDSGLYWNRWPVKMSAFAADTARMRWAIASFASYMSRNTDSVSCQRETKSLLDAMEGHGREALLRTLSLVNECIDDPDSPWRNEELLIPFLRRAVASDVLTEEYKVRPRDRLRRAMMNRTGTPAADFAYVTREGEAGRLSEMGTPYTVLYFFNPECHDCTRATEMLAKNQTVNDLMRRGELTVLAVYPDEDTGAWDRHVEELPATWTVAQFGSREERELYDIRAIPYLCLIGEGRKVLLKDVPLYRIDEYLNAGKANF